MQMGELERVDLRELWSDEASYFTPWLANENNISKLGEAINIELEVQGQEEAVGPFRADILCKDTISNKYVLVENQLEKTDHIHLGQIITYAAGLDAVTIVWIAKSFTDEHRAAIDWLNEITTEDIGFFGIEIEVWKIGDSLPAPKFNIVSKPNDWKKAAKKKEPPTDLTDAGKLKFEYWTNLKEYLNETSSMLKTQKPTADHWTSFAVGKSNFNIAAVIDTQKNIIRVELAIFNDLSKEKFSALREQFEDDSKESIDTAVFWDMLEGKKMSRIYVNKEVDVWDRNKWSEQHEWLKLYLEKFDSFFRQRIKNI
jgi:hypothetical protein